MPGKILYIPAYWWYTFKFGENTSVSCFKYRTYMNNIAISPNIFMYALQNQNIERKIAKQIDISELQKDIDNNNSNYSNNDNNSNNNNTTSLEDLNTSNVENLLVNSENLLQLN